jgi:hypothetical protein
MRRQCQSKMGCDGCVGPTDPKEGCNFSGDKIGFAFANEKLVLNSLVIRLHL